MLGVERAHVGPLLWRVLCFSFVACAALLWLTSSAPAREIGTRKIAALPTARQLPTTAVARPTPAWTEFCQRVPIECGINLSEPAIIRLTRESWNAIQTVNSRVNASIIPISDHEHWGVLDRWDLPTDGYGDCEDIQLLKRKLLAESGRPRRAMRMTVVIDHFGDGHAVLMMRTDRGDFILDNKTDAILPWDRTGYVFSKREGHDSTAWVSLGGAASPVVTANR
jgi:predicted transglutaminase-like cysteine proteinase